MRTKPFLLLLTCVVMTTFLLILFGSAGQQNESLKNIVSQTHQQFRNLKKNLRESNSDPRPEIDPKYLAQLGFTQPIYNGSRSNFTIVTYALPGELASTVLFVQNVAMKLPNQALLVYDLGLAEADLHTLQAFCNSSTVHCTVITYDLSTLPAHVSDHSMHAFRPIIIHDALARAKVILFTENNVRLKGGRNGARDIEEIRIRTENSTSGVLGCATKQPVTSRTHPKMFEYFEIAVDNFFFLRISWLEFVFFCSCPWVRSSLFFSWVGCGFTLGCFCPVCAASFGWSFSTQSVFRSLGCRASGACSFGILVGMPLVSVGCTSLWACLSVLSCVATLARVWRIFATWRRSIRGGSCWHFFGEALAMVRGRAHSRILGS
uniref:Secreted protein n=1 Tax=Anopheles darlingi TaxID=43151 RepID=A0A2M4DQL6_ANODA